MLTIRLSRVGKTKHPSYRLIVSEKTKDPWGRYLENLGFYNPKAKPKVIQFDIERIKYWLSKGAQSSDTAHNLFIDQNIIDGKKRKKMKISKKRAAKLATEKPAAAAETEEAAALSLSEPAQTVEKGPAEKSEEKSEAVA